MDSFCTNSIDIWIFLGKVINIAKIVIPILIVFFGTLDLGKAVIAGEDKEIKGAQKMFVKRIIYGVIVFFLPVIIHTVFNVTDTDALEKDSKVCWECTTKVNGSECANYMVEK